MAGLGVWLARQGRSCAQPEEELRGAESEWEVNSELSLEALGLEALIDKETEGLPRGGNEAWLHRHPLC